jgi:hypothetical protein
MARWGSGYSCAVEGREGHSLQQENHVIAYTNPVIFISILHSAEKGQF